MHEWISARPPWGVLAGLAAASDSGCIVWVTPQPRQVGRALAGPQMDRVIFVAADERLWAADVASRSPGVGAVLVDGSGFGLRETRRLQLAAEAGLKQGGGGMVLLVRPRRERTELSAAMTRWLVSPAPTGGSRPRWRLDLVRRKSSHPVIQENWLVEWDREKGAVAVPADVAGGSGAPARGEGEDAEPERGREWLRLRHTA